MKKMSSRTRVFTGVALAAVALGAVSTLMSEPDHPLWWLDRGVTNTNPVQNKGVANIGQLKHMATEGKAEMDAALPGGAGFNLPFAAPPANPDVAWFKDQKKALNLGQLKAVAKLFYDRLNGISPAWVEGQLHANGLTTLGTDYFKDTATGYFYPWDPSTPVAQNYKVANIGQLKSVFALRLRESKDGDDAPDILEHASLGTTDWPISAEQDSDGDGIPDIDELRAQADPAQRDIDGDNVNDAADLNLFQARPVRGINGNISPGVGGQLEFWRHEGEDVSPTHGQMKVLFWTTQPHTDITAKTKMVGCFPTFSNGTDTQDEPESTGVPGQYIFCIDFPSGNTNPVELEIYLDGATQPTWTGSFLQRQVSTWKISQPLSVTLGGGGTGNIDGNTYRNREVFPLVRSEGGNYKISVQWDIQTGKTGYRLALVGLPDQDVIKSPVGNGSHDFEFQLPSYTLGGYQPSLCLIRDSNDEILYRTPLSFGGYDVLKEWNYTYLYDTPSTITPSPKCAPCSTTETSNETDPHLPKQNGEACAAGYTSFDSTSDNKVDVTTSAGTTANGRGLGDLSTRADNLGGSAAGGGSLPASEDPAKPESLQVSASESVSVTMDATDSYPAIVSTSTGTAKVESVDSSGNGYTINFYKPGGTQPQTCLKIVRPTTLETDGSQALRYIEQRFGSAGPGTGTVVETKYTQKKNADGSEVWVIYQGAELASKTAPAAPESAFLRKTTIEVSAERNTIRTETVTVSERRADTGVWEDVSCVENKYRRYSWGDPLVRRILDPGGRHLVSLWSYYTEESDGLKRGMVKSYQDHTGYWTEYEWDASHGRLTKVKEPFLNSAPGSADNLCKVLDITYTANSGNGLPDRRETTRILGTAVSEVLVQGSFASRSKTRVDTIGGTTGITTTMNRASVTSLSGNPDHRYTANSYEVTEVTYPDGTKHTCSWSYEGALRKQECKQGNAALTRGTKTVTKTDLIGNALVVESHVLDFNNVAGNNQLLSTVTRSNLDGLCRPLTTTTTFADGSPAQTTTLLYGCCGLRTRTDIRGVVTTYHHDHLKRLETVESLDVVRATQYNGLTSKSIRIPIAVAPKDSHQHYTVRGMAVPPAGAIVQGERESNKAGEYVASRSASPQSADGTSLVTTTYAYMYDAGTTTTVVYPDAGQSVTITARDGRTLSVSGTAVNDMVYEYGPTLPGVTFGNGAVFGSKATQANGTQWTASTADLLGRGVETHFADGAKATMHYNALNQLVRSVDPDGVTMLYAYNDEGERTQRAADLNGNNILETATDRVTFSETNATTGHDGSTYVWETVSKVYGTSGGSLDTGKGQRSIDGLKSWNVPFAIAARASSSTTVLAGGGNWTTTSVSPTGLRSISTYSDGLLDNTIIRGGNSVETINSTDYFYDAHNRVNKTTDARTGDTTVAYLNNDQQSSVTQVRAGTNSLTTGFTYDPMGRTLTTDSPDTLDSIGATLSNIVTRTYDQRGNVLTVDGDQTYKRDYTYDALSRLTTLKTFGTSTSVTTWNYNAQRGWLDDKKYPDVNNPLQQGVGTTYSYTSGGRLKGRGWARGVNTTWHYDFEGNDTGFGVNAKAGDLQGVTYSDGSTPATAYSYKQWGAVAAVNDVTGTRTLVYRETIDLQLTTEQTSDNVTSLAQQQVSIPRLVTRGFDALGRTTYSKLTDIGTGTLEHCQGYGYDAQTGRLSTVLHGNSALGLPEALFTCNYVQNSNLPESVTGPAHKVTNSYEAHRDVLKTKSHRDKQVINVIISDINYGSPLLGTDAVNGIGQRFSAARSSNAVYSAVANTEVWKYNAKGEVVTADHSVNTKDRTYSFDGIGNRTSVTDNTGTTASTPNALNQLGNVGGTTRVHDLDGNLTDDGTNLYIWDAENRLVMVKRKSDNVVIAEYRYDYMHRRVYKETTAIAPQGMTVSLYHYEGWNLCAEYNGTAISGSTNAAVTSVRRTYTWGQDLSGSLQGAGGVGGLLTIEEKQGAHAGKYYPLYDGNGNVTELVKEGGATGTTLVAHYEYDPFGNLTQNDDKDGSGYNAVNPFKFSTKYHDEETDLYYYGYRYYDSAVGRWLSRDPIEEQGGINLYGFVYNSPLNWFDILGWAPKAVNGGFGFTGFKDKQGNSQDGFFKDMAGGRNHANVGSGATGKDLINHMASLSKDNCCIDVYRIGSHGGSSGIGGGAKGATGLKNDNLATMENEAVKVEDMTEDHFERYAQANQNDQGEWMTLEEAKKEHAGKKGWTLVPKKSTDHVDRDKGGRDLADLNKEIMAKNIRFCKGCKIYIHACHMNDLFSRRLARITKCKVIYGGGLCSPTSGISPNRPWKNAQGFKEVSPDGSIKSLGNRITPPKL